MIFLKILKAANRWLETGKVHISMIIFLQSVTIQFRRFFSHILYYIRRQINFITKSDGLLL